MKTARFLPMLFMAHILSKITKADLKDIESPTLINPYRGHAISGYNPVFIPRHGKFKG